jgi:hypothetical protein
MRAGQPTCEVMFSQAKVYGIVGGVAVSAKHGADISGDAHSMLELADGRGVFIISDGMGTGKKCGDRKLYCSKYAGKTSRSRL